MHVSELIQKYVAARDKKEELDAKYKEKVKVIDNYMTKIEGLVLAAMEKNDVRLMSSEAGTAYMSTRNSCTTADKQAFLDYIKSNEEWGLLDARPLKSAVEVFIEANDGDLPPGINWRSENVLRIRRSS